MSARLFTTGLLAATAACWLGAGSAGAAVTVELHSGSSGRFIDVEGTSERDELRLHKSQMGSRVVVRSFNQQPVTAVADSSPGPGVNAGDQCRQLRLQGSGRPRPGPQPDVVSCALAPVHVAAHEGDDLVAAYPNLPVQATVDGDQGNDTIWLGNGTGNSELRQIAFGGWGNDTIVGSHLGDDIFGGDQFGATPAGTTDRDTLYGLDGADRLLGDEDNDLLFGGDHHDKLFDDERGWVTDPLTGSFDHGSDQLVGGTGWDDLVSTQARDYLYAKEQELKLMALQFPSARLTEYGPANKPPEPDSLYCGIETYIRKDIGHDRIAAGTCKGDAPPR